MGNKDDTSRSEGTVWEFSAEHGEADFSFNLETISIGEVVQMVSRNSWTGSLIVQTIGKKAQVYFDKGKLTACSLGASTGHTAFYCLSSWKVGKGIFCQIKREVEPEFSDTALSYIMEGARLADEWQRVRLLKPVRTATSWKDIPPEDRFFIEAVGQYSSLQELADHFEIEGVELFILLEDCLENEWLALPDLPKGTTDHGTAETVEIERENSVNGIKVMVIDDNMIVRKILKRSLGNDPAVAHVEECRSLKDGLEKIADMRPDVVILDVILPEMNGAAAIPHIRYRPDVPVVMLASDSQEGMSIALECLHGDAIDFIGKPGSGDKLKALEAQGPLLASKIRRAARFPCAALKKLKPLMSVSESERHASSQNPASKIIVLGGGVGAYPAFLDILSRLTSCPDTAVLLVQYMPELSLDLFIEQIRRYCRLPVYRARLSDFLKENSIYVMSAPAFACRLYRKDEKLYLKIEAYPRMLKDLDACETLSLTMKSLGEKCGKKGMALVLPGIGVGIGAGVQALEMKGGQTYFLDEWVTTLSCVLPHWGAQISPVDRSTVLELIQEFGNAV